MGNKDYKPVLATIEEWQSRPHSGPKPRPLLERFWEKVDITPGCWLWKGTPDAYGYGRIKIARQMFKAHRLSYELLVGEIPDSHTLDHTCLRHLCVNPEHLEPVLAEENSRRGSLRVNRRMTHCRAGHEFTPENTRMAKQVKKETGVEYPTRVCRECMRRFCRESRERKRLREG